MGVYLGEDKVANGGFIGNYDSLPVGSVIEFDGDEVPAGYEQVKGLVTGGPAVKTGRIIDGKEEYVKRFNIGLLPNNTRNVITLDMPSASDIKVLNVTGSATKLTNGYEDCVPIYTVVVTFLYRSSEKNLFVDTTMDRSDYTGYAEIYFTYR